MTRAPDPRTPACATVAVGSLPHRSLAEAAEFAWTATDVPTLPSLPRRSPAEGMIAQALLGVPGVHFGPYGSLTVDGPPLRGTMHATVDGAFDAKLAAPVDEAFGGMLAALRAATGRRREASVVKWQVTGPVTLAFALMRAGLAPADALAVADRAVGARVSSLQELVVEHLPRAVQIVTVDEPSLGAALESPDLGTDTVLDAVSGALAAVAPWNVAGLHCCADVGLDVLLATGPAMVSIPVPPAGRAGSLAPAAARLSDHLDNGGTVAWGVVRTDGPVPASGDGPFRALVRAWSELAAAGVDLDALHRRSFLSPACGLGTHAVPVARRIADLVGEVARRCADRDAAFGAATGPIT